MVVFDPLRRNFPCINNCQALTHQQGSIGQSEKIIRKSGGLLQQNNNNMYFLRLVFASMVIFSHSFELLYGNRTREPLTQLFGTMTFGEVGVAGFFVLSGYLISKSWESSSGFFDYLQRRILRIYPGFIVAVLVTAYVFGPLGTDWRNYFAELDVLALIRSIVLLQVPALPPTRIGNGALWTIQAEFLCYILISAIGILAFARFQLTTLLLLVVVAYLLQKPALFAPVTLFGYFLSGAVFYAYRTKIRYGGRGSIIALVILALCMPTPKAAWIGFCTVGAYLIFAASFVEMPILQKLNSKADISYGTYLYGWPIQMTFICYLPKISPWVLFFLTLALSMICGWLSFKFVESPFIEFGKRMYPQKGPTQRGSKPTR